MLGWNWDEILVVGLIAVCVLGPICIVMLTQNLMGAEEEIEAEHFDFSMTARGVPDAESSREQGKR